MKRLAILSIVVIAAGTVSAPAIAQTTVGNLQVPEDQMGRVEGYCRALEVGSTATGPLPPLQGLDFRRISLNDCREAGLLPEIGDEAGGNAQN